MSRVEQDAVFVEAHGRLHFGVLDLRGHRGRWFGGIGAAAPGPTLLISACVSDRIEVVGDDVDENVRAEEFARRFLEFHQLPNGVRLSLHRLLPTHCGLGSGTQLGLAVAQVIGSLYDIKSEPAEHARAIGRAQRSAIGTWTFARGGFVVEGGRKRDGERLAPLLAHMTFPRSWECVVAIPHAIRGISGKAEETAFSELPLPDIHDVERVAHIVLMALLPALAEGDLETFGTALTEIQLTTGGWFAHAQGGVFAAGPGAELVSRMTEWGAKGVGQSSWGPTVFGIVEGPAKAARLAEHLRRMLNGGGTVWHGPFPEHGARVWRGQARTLALSRR
jgi:beta-RFAP synthase